MTSLTREALLSKAKRRMETVEVEGFGAVTIRSQSAMQRSRRVAMTYNESGNRVPLQITLQNLYAIVDQVCDESGSPLFTDADIGSVLGDLDPLELDPLLEAIDKFNERDPENGKK